ncbi:MAG: hypothetical protein HYW86_05175 [Candidatus Roizmanbacteria bacterium]|nr:MAG: hypothetical protein HYW86_05175 [Candidatus Roizmanbacteria bacterium]
MADSQAQVNTSGNKDDFRKFVEVEVLKIIQQLAEKGDTPKERIQAIAHTTLELVKPEMTLQEMYQNAVKLDDQYSELSPVVYKLMKEYEEKYSQKAIEMVSHLIKNGQYNEAQDMVKKVLMFKITN